MNMRRLVAVVVMIPVALAMAGCSVRIFKGSPEDLEQIQVLSDKVDELEGARMMLEQRLKGEIASKDVSVERSDRGIVITFVDEVLFDSGKDKLREEALPILDKVISVVKSEASGHNVGIEGHTDDQPIKHSGWKSNWELSTARAISVLHYLEDSGMDPRLLQATGYGEYRPVVSNDTKSGQQQNRRVEIVILTGKFTKGPLSEAELQEDVK